jgi:hypothetical protein
MKRQSARSQRHENIQFPKDDVRDMTALLL